MLQLMAGYLRVFLPACFPLLGFGSYRIMRFVSCFIGKGLFCLLGKKENRSSHRAHGGPLVVGSQSAC